MRTSLKIIPIIVGALLFFTQCEKDSYNATEEPEFTDDLKKSAANTCILVQDFWAGAAQNSLSKGTLVGEVTAEFIDPSTLRVSYSTESPWLLSEAHVWVGKNHKSIPKNAAPGLFPYSGNYPYSNSAEFIISLSDHGINPGETVYIAAHGVVGQPDGVSALEYILPDSVTLNVVNPNPTLGSYFEATVSGGTSLDGKYSSWCIDPENVIYPSTNYNATVYSPHSDIPEGLLQNPENLDLVIWLLNQNLVGTPATDCEGNYTYGDIQIALWELLVEGDYSGSRGIGEYSMCRVDELVDLARANGDGFVPVCGQKTALILFVPDIQLTIIEYPVPCGKDETAWAYGDYTFIKTKIANKWGWFFGMTCNL